MARYHGGSKPLRARSLTLGNAREGDYPIVDHEYDVVVVGAGGAGLRAAFGSATASKSVKS